MATDELELDIELLDELDSDEILELEELTVELELLDKELEIDDELIDELELLETKLDRLLLLRLDELLLDVMMVSVELELLLDDIELDELLGVDELDDKTLLLDELTIELIIELELLDKELEIDELIDELELLETKLDRLLLLLRVDELLEVVLSSILSSDVTQPVKLSSTTAVMRRCFSILRAFCM